MEGPKPKFTKPVNEGSKDSKLKIGNAVEIGKANCPIFHFFLIKDPSLVFESAHMQSHTIADPLSTLQKEEEGIGGDGEMREERV